jgi:hypothetical protein
MGIARLLLLAMLALIARTRAPLFFRSAATTIAEAKKVPLFSKYSNTDANLANVGVRWTDAEIQELVSSIAAKETLEAVALKHKRTVNSIKAKLAFLAGAEIAANPASKAGILSKYNVTVADIEELDKQNAARKQRLKSAPKKPSDVKTASPAAVGDPNAPPRPAMLGKPWTSEHNEELMKQASARKAIADIASLLARTPKSVEMRIAQLSLDKGLGKASALLSNTIALCFYCYIYYYSAFEYHCIVLLLFELHSFFF